MDGSGVKNTEPGPKVTLTVHPFTTCTGEQTGVQYLAAKHQLSTKKHDLVRWTFWVFFKMTVAPQKSNRLFEKFPEGPGDNVAQTSSDYLPRTALRGSDISAIVVFLIFLCSKKLACEQRAADKFKWNDVIFVCCAQATKSVIQ